MSLVPGRQCSVKLTRQGAAQGRLTLPLGVSFHGCFYREQPWKRRVSVARAEARLVCSLSQRRASSQNKGSQVAAALSGWRLLHSESPSAKVPLPAVHLTHQTCGDTNGRNRRPMLLAVPRMSLIFDQHLKTVAS